MGTFIKSVAVEPLLQEAVAFLFISRQSENKIKSRPSENCLMSLVAHRLGRVEFRIFVVVFYREAQLKKLPRTKTPERKTNGRNLINK